MNMGNNDVVDAVSQNLRCLAAGTIEILDCFNLSALLLVLFVICFILHHSVMEASNFDFALFIYIMN